MPLPSDPRTVFLAGLFLLALLAALFVAREIILPLMLALVLKLLLQPVVHLLERVRVPRALGALVAVLLLVGVVGGIGLILSGPAATWAQTLPQQWPKLQEQLSWGKEYVGNAQRSLQGLGIDTGQVDPQAMLSKLNPGALVGGLASGAGGFASSSLETLLILFYLLVFGETFLRRLVEVLPRFADKRQAVEIGDQVARDLSAYILTITLINAVVGIVIGLMCWAFGIPGPPMWGVLAFLLNFIPILGPLAGVVLFVVIGLVTLGAGWFSLLPAVGYLAVHVLEGEIVTPMLLAKRFTLNPVAVMLALIFWFWMWGIAGAVLAVPLLAMTKIIADRITSFRAFGHLLEG